MFDVFKNKLVLLNIGWVFLLLITSSGKSYGFHNYSFKHYNINNGLSQNTVHSIFQDKQGFMWFGTKDGLNRFDGNSFKIFKFSPNENLRDNVFHHILEDKDGKIWIATEDGVYIYDPRQEKFERFEAVTPDNLSLDGWISDFIQDKDGDIWISIEDKGVFHYNITHERLVFYPVTSLPGGMRMISICIGNNNDIWVFPYGIPPVRIDKETGQTSKFQLADNPELLHNLGEVRNVIADGNNQLILPTSHQGLISINTANRTARVLLDSDSSGNPIFVRTVARIDNHTLWVGTESGLYILNTLEGSIQNLRHDHLVPTSLSDNAIYSIYKDRDDGVWVGTYFGGVDYYSEQLNKFDLFYSTSGANNMQGSRIREFCPADDDKLWIGTEDNGLHLFDPKTKTFLPLPDPLKSLYNNIHALCNDGQYLWIGTFSKGLNRYNPQSGELVAYTNSGDIHSISQNSPFSIFRDKLGTLWIGTLAGLNIYDYEKNNFIRIDALQGIAIQDVFEDNKQRIWVSTFSDGLYQYNRGTDEWRIFKNDQNDHTSLPYNKVLSVYQDSHDRIWITTQGGGFSRFVEEDEVFVTINSTDGLPNDVVYQIVEDNDSNLWLSTNAGLVRYNPQNGTFRNFTIENGLRTNQFNYKSSYKCADGTIYFGSLDGFVRFNPATFSEPGQQYPIYFTGLSVNNVPVSPANEKSVLSESILFADQLILPYNKNSLRFDYTVLNYSNQNASQIVYKLNGFDKDWIDAKGNRSIVYSNLNPGTYTLDIKLNSDVDNEYSKSLVIRIKPPLWLSVWAYVFYFILLVSAVLILIYFLRMRESNLRKRKMMEFEQIKERELYRSKINFFTNVAHEIRTPLSLIKAPLDFVLMTQKVSDEVKDNLQIVNKNADRLLNLTNQLLDFRKTESEAYSLRLKTQNVSELMRETFLRFTVLAKQRQLDFSLDLPENDIYAQVDKEAFLKIISNLMGNAIKYCDNFVHIKAYESKTERDELSFHVITENDGERIPQHYKDEVFKPFVHIDRQMDRKVDGTGIGLALSRSLTELHKGTLSLDGDDTLNRFHLILPIGEVVKPAQGISDNEQTQLQEEQTKDKKSPQILHTILLVDDDAELLDFEAKFLSTRYHVLTAENGVQAMDVLKEANVNLIVSDVMMPEMDGFELTRKIKSDIEFSHIPIILLTAKTNVQSKVKGFETGADSYIEKPFSVEILMAQIANLLQNREKLRETFLKHPFIGANSIAFTKSDEEFIIKMNAIVHENIDNSDFIVEDIAEHFNMSRASFYRKIKGVLNLTPNEYIRIERLKKAALLLKEKEYKVNEVCYMVGFNSPSYFSKCFQQQFGILPKDFV